MRHLVGWLLLAIFWLLPYLFVDEGSTVLWFTVGVLVALGFASFIVAREEF